MQISANIQQFNLSEIYQKRTQQTAQKREDAVSQMKQELEERSFSLSVVSVDIQINFNDGKTDTFQQNYDDFQSFLSGIGYDGKPIAQLSQDEAKELVSEDGFFGITKTAERIANFVLSGAGNDEDLLRAGRQGILQGFKEAEAMWGGKLPDISYKTIEKATQIIDTAMHEMGYAIISEEV